MDQIISTLPLEVVADVTPLPELQLIVQQQALPPETAANLFAAWAPHFKAARDIIEESRKIVVTDASDTRKMKLSGVNRLALKKLRVAADDFREKLKAESLRTGNAIQGFWHIFLAMVAAEEQRLKEQEDYVEIQEEKRQAALTEARSLVLTGLNINPALYQLGAMDEAVFQQLVEGTKLARAAEAERVKKAEADRIDHEAKEQAERERIRLENERLKREADEKEAALKAEREKVAAEKAEADAKAALERAAVEKELERLADEKAEAAKAAKAELDRREALAAEERRKHEEAAAEIRRVAKEAADKAAKEKADAEAKAKAELEAAEKETARQLAEQKRIADQAAAAERTRVEKERIAAEAIAKAEREAAAKKALDERVAIELAERAKREVAAKKAREEFAAAEEVARKERLRLQALAEVERQKAATAAKEAAAKVMAAELEKAKIEAELRAAKEEQAARHAAQLEAEHKAALAPAKDKLLNYANAIRAIEIPTDAQAIVTVIKASRDKFCDWVSEKANAL